MGRRIIHIILSFIFIASSIAFSQSFLNRFRVPVLLEGSMGVGYDNNFLKLSPSEIEEIEIYPTILGDADQISSAIMKNSFSLSYKPYIWGGHETRIKTKVSFSYYAESKNKAYQVYSLNFSQHLGNYEWVKLSYSYLPQYYLRDYRDRDVLIVNASPNSILSNCFFSQGSSTISYSRPFFLNRTWLEGKMNYKTQYYNPAFTEFDMDIIGFGLKLNTQYLKHYSFSLSGIKTNAVNPTYENGLRSTSQISRGYEQTNFFISLNRKEIDLYLFQKAGLTYSRDFRQYVSQSEEDPLHRNRSHIENKTKFWMAGEMNDQLGYQILLTTRKRKTKSEEYDWVEELKNFSKTELLLTFSYQFTSNILY